MKKIIILLLLIAFTKAYAQEPVIPVAKKVVNQFIKFGTKAGVNFNTSGDLDEIISDNPSLANSRENINGFYVGIYSEIKLLMLYLRPELHYSEFTDNLSNKQSRLEAPISLGIKVLSIFSRSEKGKQNEFSIDPLFKPFLGSGTLPSNLSKLLASITLNLFSKIFLSI